MDEPRTRSDNDNSDSSDDEHANQVDGPIAEPAPPHTKRPLADAVPDTDLEELIAK